MCDFVNIDEEKSAKCDRLHKRGVLLRAIAINAAPYDARFLEKPDFCIADTVEPAALGFDLVLKVGVLHNWYNI